MQPIVLIATAPIPHLRLHQGDRVIFDPRTSSIPQVQRGPLAMDLPNPGAVLGAFTAGYLRPLTPVSMAVLLLLAG